MTLQEPVLERGSSNVNVGETPAEGQLGEEMAEKKEDDGNILFSFFVTVEDQVKLGGGNVIQPFWGGGLKQV